MKTACTLRIALHYTACLLIACAVPVNAPAAGTTADSDVFRVMPYLWGAQFAGNSGDGDNDADTGGKVLFDDLELGGLMLFGEWQRARWSVFGDWSYASVTSDAAVRLGPVRMNGEIGIKGHIVELATGYELQRSARSHTGLFGGLRYIHVDVDVEATSGILAGRTVNVSDGWTNAITGLRGAVQLNPSWQLSWYGDVGAGESKVTWQLLAMLGYNRPWGQIDVGWRHLDEDYESAALHLDARLTGPFLGVQFEF